MLGQFLRKSVFRYTTLKPQYTKLFINNEWVDSEDGATMDVISPATEEKFATISRAGEKDAEKAIKFARKAFDDPKVRKCIY